MRLLPETLFGRITLTLIVGLLSAQVIGAMLLLENRKGIFQQRFGMQLMQRIVSVVTLVENMAPEERVELPAALSSPGFRVSLSDQPIDIQPNTHRSDHFERILQSSLTRHNKVIVAIGRPNQPPLFVERRADRRPHNRDRRMRWHEGEPAPLNTGRRPIITTTQVELSDGRWIIFSRALPAEITQWPLRILGYLLILIFSIVALSLFVVRLITRPLAMLSTAADSLGKNIEQPPVPETGSFEVKQAARAFNTMHQRLKRYIEDRNQVLAAVSHDLKTPITRLRLRAETIAPSTLSAKIKEDLSEMEQMVTASLDYLRGTDSQEKAVSVDIHGLLESLQDDMFELGWQFELAAEEILPIKGRPLGLKRCLGNLIENAVRYGTSAKVIFRDSPGKLEIVVTDEGPGIAEQDLEVLFKPFSRGEKSRNRETGGSGLGLGIARNIARAHGGDIMLRNLEPHGLQAIVTLPR